MEIFNWVVIGMLFISISSFILSLIILAVLYLLLVKHPEELMLQAINDAVEVMAAYFLGATLLLALVIYFCRIPLTEMVLRLIY